MSGWLSDLCDDVDNIEEYIEWVKYEARIAVE